jgi:hypothetical protein
VSPGCGYRLKTGLPGRLSNSAHFAERLRLTPKGLAAIRRFADFGQDLGFDLIGENASLQGFDGRLERCPSG